MTPHSSQKLIAIPVQVIECVRDSVDDRGFKVQVKGAILKRGVVEVEVKGEGAAEAIQIIRSAATGEGSTRKELCDLFAPEAKEAVEQLIEQLMIRRLLVSEEASPVMTTPESNVDIFYWSFGTTAKDIRHKLSTTSLTIVGVNYISRQLTASLRDAGFERVRMLDHPRLRNPQLLERKEELENGKRWIVPSSIEEWSGNIDPSSFDCLIATSDYGAHGVLRECNRLCLEHRRYFLPVTLYDLTGYVGPIVVPGETACFECLLARQNSHLDDPKTYRFIEAAAYDGQDVNGFHPSMASILGNIAAFELTKFYSQASAKSLIGSLTEVNLMAGAMHTRKVLRIPRCTACSSLRTTPATSARQSQREEKSRAKT